jgi:hypothetical protein
MIIVGTVIFLICMIAMIFGGYFRAIRDFCFQIAIACMTNPNF